MWQVVDAVVVEQVVPSRWVSVALISSMLHSRDCRNWRTWRTRFEYEERSGRIEVEKCVDSSKRGT